MRQIDIHKLADDARFSKFHAGVLFWCALVIIFDGYDLAVAGIALPSIMQELKVPATQAGVMVSSALFGAMCGAVLLGTMADRIGRRRTIALCVALFSIFTALAGMANDPVTFSAARFVAGLGIGGVMPAVVAHMQEYSPRRLKTTLVTLMFSGYSVGGMIAAVLGKGLIASYGWQAVFYAAAAPIAVIPFLLALLPESMAYLAKRNRQAQLASIAARLSPGMVPRVNDSFVVASSTPGGKSASGSMGTLLADGRAQSTCMFWITFFMCLFMVYALSSWLAKLMAGAGYSLGSALTFVLVLNIGGMIGAIGGGMLADRFKIRNVLIGMFALAAMSISLLGFKSPTPVLYLLLCAAGASTIGTQIVVYAYAGQFYPMEIRATGIGVASGVGRVGAIAAPVIIGTVVGLSLPLHQNFMLMAIPAVVAMCAVSMIDRRRAALPAVHTTELQSTEAH
ncbi:Major facilitator superfamily (MFS) profile domain-containing protein (plasmid) [Cupriavidus sp. H19C3]|uniref:MFS transporter n=1 Tax=Cupriavidus sp. H19C3 TaxID=3241603 RepID=UPI003BF8F155